MKTKQFPLKLKDEMKSKIRERSEKMGINMAALLRIMINEYFDNHK